MNEATRNARVQVPRVSGVELSYDWFCRAVGLICMVMGLAYWIRLIGIYDGALWRFDLMPLHWQVACTVLSVLFPIAATGLWMTVSWGPVIWILAVATEIAMYAGFPELYGARPALVALHVMTVIVFAALRILLAWEAYKRTERPQ